MKLLKSFILVAYAAFALVWFGACNSSSGNSTPATIGPMGNVQVAFTGTISFNGVTPTRFKNVFVNVTNVLLNTKAGATASSKKWRTITVPTNPPVGSPPGAFQIDLNNVSALTPDFGPLPIVYNTGLIPSATYHQLQIQLDSAPGTIVPLCAPAPGPLEGCIAYPIQFTGPQTLIVPLLNPIKVAKGTPNSILINLNLTVDAAPTTTGGPYTVGLAVTPIATNTAEATVTGTVTGNSGQVHSGETVTAEAAGTNTVVGTTTVQNGAYTFALPATDAGTLYDLAITGGTSQIAAMRLDAITPSSAPTPDFVLVDGQTTGGISGIITDQCTGAAVEGATVQILIPPSNNSSANTETCMTPSTTGECVSVATATTDATGTYPTANSKGQITGAFSTIPILTNKNKYTIAISAPGYDTIYEFANATSTSNKHPGDCAAPGDKSTLCDFSLTSSRVTGNIQLTAIPPSGQTVNVEVFAENTGTNTLVAALPQPLVFTNTTPQSQTFTMQIPTTNTYSALDFFAEAVDTYKGAANPFTGHTIVAMPHVDTLDPVCPYPSPAPSIGMFAALDCIGHGSVAGDFGEPADNLTSAELLVAGVQVISSGAGPTVASLGDGPSYAICAPGGGYDLQRFQVTNPAPGTTPVMTPTPAAVGTPVAIDVPTAAPTSSGCPTTCSSSSDGSTCPGNCLGVNQQL